MDEKQLVELVVSQNNIVTKSNRLIEAEYRMTATEFKIVQTVFSNIQPNSSEHSTFIFPIRQFMDMLELKGNSGYAELKKITRNLFKPIEITVDGETNQVSWFQLVNYNEKSGTITIEVNSFWQEFLYSLENNFTSYKLFNITHLSSSYSPRIYELLKSRINLSPKRRITLKELRAKVGVADDQYPKYANFKQRVLLPAQRELKEKSDIHFEFTEHKLGRSVHSIEFHIYRNSTKKAIEPIVMNHSDLESQLSLFGLTEEAIAKLLESYDEQLITANIRYTQKRMETTAIQNPAAYLKTAIEQNYAETAKKAAWSERDQRDAELVKQLKEKGEGEDTGGWTNTSPEEFESLLLEIADLKQKYSSEKQIRETLKDNMVKFQQGKEQKTGNLISPSTFTDPLIKEICKEALKSLYI